VQSPLLEEVAITGATGLLLNVTAGPDLKLHEVNEAACYIQEQTHEDANIIFGAVVDERMGDDLKVTVIATGFESRPELVTDRPRTAHVDEDLDIPTHIRKYRYQTEMPKAAPLSERAPVPRPAIPKPKPMHELPPTIVKSEIHTELTEEEELDVPTFLRRPDR
jgi:cell division protein FtsZ